MFGNKRQLLFQKINTVTITRGKSICEFWTQTGGLFVIFARKQEKIWKKSIVKLLHYLKVVKKIDGINMGKNLKSVVKKIGEKKTEKTF